MTDYSKIIFVNAAGDYEETSAVDTLKFASFKTTSFELTDTLLGKLVNAISTSAGAADAAKYLITNASGQVDISFIPQSSIDHGTITGLGDDDHTQYILAAGTRAFTGPQSMGSFKLTNLANGTATNDAVNFGQLTAVENMIGTLEFQDSVIDRATTPPGSPTTGDRYLVIATATGAWATKEDQIAEWNGTSWVYTAPTTGMLLSVDDENTVLYYYGGSAWDTRSFEASTASYGVEKVGMDLRLDLLSGGGLKITGNEEGVEPNDFAGQGLVDDGSDNLAIDWSTAYNDSKAVKASDLSSVATGKGASIIGLEDSGSYTAQTNVEGAIQELYGQIAQQGVNYTVGAGGVTKGDVVYVSGNNTVLPWATLSTARAPVGIAAATVAASGTVKVLGDDTVLTSVLTGATAGTKYYWTGSAFSATQTTTSGNHVIYCGVAKNATDLHVEGPEVLKKNA
jgi:hypothetical protein